MNTKKLSSQGTPNYQNSNDPILKYPKNVYSPTQTQTQAQTQTQTQPQSRAQSIRDGQVQTPEKDDMPLSPLSIVHVRQEFEVTRIAASDSDGSVKARSETSLG